MSDLIRDLRESANMCLDGFDWSICDQAADEIERLRRELTEARDLIAKIDRLTIYNQHHANTRTLQTVVSWADAYMHKPALASDQPTVTHHPGCTDTECHPSCTADKSTGSKP